MDGCGLLVAKGGLAAVGGVGFGPKDVRLAGAGSPSETEARGRLALFEVVDLTEPTGEAPRAGALETSGVDGRLAAGGLGGRDGRRIAVEEEGARDEEFPVLAVDIALVGEVEAFAVGALVVVEAGLVVAEAALAVFLRVAVADGGLEVVDELAAFDTVGGEGLTDPAPKVPELIT